ncbi:MAG TPA: hypothetical protein VL326_11445 [Kofleriaceae bacterium]|nr:hypothetical protein [Kofleriaceae bacterium]
MAPGVIIHGLEASEGETAFAFCVLRFAEPVARPVLVSTLGHVAALVPDADAIVGDLLPDDLEQEVLLITIPWMPAEAGHGHVAQRRLVESAASFGVVEAWFFQTSTSLPPLEDEDDDDTDDAFDDNTRPIELFDASTGTGLRALSVAGEIGGDVAEEIEAGATEESDEEDDAAAAADSEPAEWSYGTPPEVEHPEFPVDDYPQIIDEYDGEDFGIAIKLADDMQSGEGTVLLGFHTLWLAPYGGRYRNAGVRIDRRHHAAHFWVERFAVNAPAAGLVRHLLWIVSKLADVVPVVRARFVGATMAQKYASIMGDASEPFVLGGNPLLAIYEADGEAAVDRWLAERTQWSDEEAAQMLRELAIEIATAGQEPVEDEGEGDDDDDDEDGDDDEDADDDDDDDEAEGNEDEDRGRQITTYARELLTSRAEQGLLDPRAADKLIPLLPSLTNLRRAHEALPDDEDIN